MTFALLFFGYLFISSSGGRNDNRANAPGDSGYCANCHGVATSGGSISLTGVPGSYTAGATYPLTLTLTDANAVVGGFQIVATNGSSNTQIGSFSTPAGTRLNPSNRLVQSGAQAFSGGLTSWTFNWTAPSTGAPATVEFFYAGNAANGNGGTSGDEAYFNSTATIMPLPVELSKFEVTPMEDAKAKLTWQTNSENNSDYFEIQRSREEDDNVFESIGRIDAAGDATWTIDYAFTDESPILNQTSYYRLKQVDKDESFDYSPIQSVIVKSQETASSVFPNPVQSGKRLNIHFSNNNEQSGFVKLIDMQGKVVFVSKVEMLAGRNELSFDLPNLPLGQYLFSIERNNQVVEMSKLMVIE